MNLKTFAELSKRTLLAWSEDKAPRLGAALAYYSVFSLAPLLIIAISIAGLIFGPQAAQGQIVAQIQGTVGETTAEAVQEMLKQASDPTSGKLATVVGIVVLIFGASGVFGQLQDALNTIWKVTPKPGRGMINFFKDRFLSFAMVLGSGFLMLVSLMLTALIEAVSKHFTPDWLPGGPSLWRTTNWVVSLLVITLLFAMIFKVLPDVRLSWKDVAIGAAVTALLFMLGKFLIGLYLGYAGIQSAYGAAASVVVILIWVYYSSQLVLLGAEFTRVYAQWRGSRVVPKENARALTPEELARQGLTCQEAAAPTRS
jgi:membrane protein